MEAKLIEIPALGRALHPGTLYDCRNDTFIPGITLWDKAILRNSVSSRRQPKTETLFSSSDSLNEKSKFLSVNAALKASILGGLVDVAGSASYINDSKSSANQSRISLKYFHSTKHEELTMSQLRNIVYPQVFDDGTATHVVTAVLYGAQAFMVFETDVSEQEDKEEIQGNLYVLVKKIPSLSVEGGGALKMNDNEKKLADNTRCKFYGDFDLELNPTTFMDAMHVYKTLPSQLRDKDNDAVPLKVWLHPLSLLNKNAATLKKEIETTLITKAEVILEALDNANILCNTLTENKILNNFQDIKIRLKTFQNMLENYKLMFLKAVRNLIPAIRGGVREEKELAQVINIHHESPFRAERMNKWMEENRIEINLLNNYTRQLSGVPVVQYSSLRSNILIDPHVETVVCFCFTSLKNDDPYLSSLHKYLEVNEFEKLTKISESEDSEDFLDWFQIREVIEKALANHALFKSFHEANKDDTQTRFIIAAFSDPDHPGTCIQLFRKGELADGAYQPVSKPPVPTLEIKNDEMIVKLQKSPTGSTTKFQVDYSIVQVTDSDNDDKWKIIETDSENFTLPGFERESQFCIRYRAVGDVGVSEFSDSAIYAPEGVYRFYLSQEWNWNNATIINELRHQMMGNLGEAWLNPSKIKSDVTNTVNNPNIPYAYNIPEKVDTGMAFYLQGVVSEKLGKIHFSLKNGPKEYDDTPFELVLRPNDYCEVKASKLVVMKRGFASGCPLFKGSTFAVIVIINKENYEVYLNGRMLFVFKHFLPFDKLTTVYIHGDFIVNTVGTIPKWNESTFYKEQKPGTSSWGLLNIQSDYTYPICKPNKPYFGSIQGGFKIGMALFFQGVVPFGSRGFEIKSNPDPEDDCTFIFKTNLDSVTLNSITYGKWGIEAPDGNGIFPEGEVFDMFLLFAPAHMHAIVNGKDIYTLSKQIPATDVARIKISGDVIMNTFGIVNVDSANMTFEMTAQT